MHAPTITQDRYAVKYLQHPSVTRIAMRDIPGSGKPEELIDAAGISARHIVEAVKAIQK